MLANEICIMNPFHKYLATYHISTYTHTKGAVYLNEFCELMKVSWKVKSFLILCLVNTLFNAALILQYIVQTSFIWNKRETQSFAIVHFAFLLCFYLATMLYHYGSVGCLWQSDEVK